MLHLVERKGLPRRLALFVACLALAGCGGGDNVVPADDNEACALVEGCDAPFLPVAGPRVPVFRVLVVRDAQGVRIETVQEVDLPEAVGAPVGPSGGGFALGALDASGGLIEAQLISFPDVMRFEFLDGQIQEEDMSTARATVVGYIAVDAAVATLGIMNIQGDIVFMMDAPAPGEARVTYERGVSSAALIQASMGSGCEHVMILDGAADAIWNPNDAFPARSPTPTQLAVIRSTIGRMTPLHCAGVSRIVIVGADAKEGVGGWNHMSYGDAIFINESLDRDGFRIDEVGLQTPHARAVLAGIVAHESGHALVGLLQFSRNQPRYEGNWTLTQRDLARDTLDNARLQGNFKQAWAVLHQSFVFRGWGSDYFGNATALAESDVADVTRRGFMSHYAAKSVDEDIAEYIAWPIVDRLYASAGVSSGPGVLRRGYACQALAEHDAETIPSRFAAAFTKLSLLRSLGAITDSDLESCTGPSIGFPDGAEGITLFQDGEIQRVFDQNIAAGIGTQNSRYVYNLVAEGGAMFGDELFPATLTLRLDLGPAADKPIERVSWPRGAFTLDLGTFDSFTLRLEGAAAGNFDVSDGFVLVTEADNGIFLGSVFVTEAFRFQAPIPVPQVFDPPLQFRIRLEN